VRTRERGKWKNQDAHKGCQGSEKQEMRACGAPVVLYTWPMNSSSIGNMVFSSPCSKRGQKLLHQKFDPLGISFAIRFLNQSFDGFKGLLQNAVEGKTFDREGKSRASTLAGRAS
jgi:hypothetical protein